VSATLQGLPFRVIKLGGSLLDLRDLAERFHMWRVAQQPACDLVIVGGGRFVDDLRATQCERGLDDASMHWLAIDAMGKNASTVAKMLPESRLVSDLTFVRLDAMQQQLVVFDPAAFLHQDQVAGSLPANWDATSDSIAARIANCCGADELVLLKSALPGPDRTPAGLAKVGYVDRHFATASAGLPLVRFVNLRGAAFLSVDLEAPCRSRRQIKKPEVDASGLTNFTEWLVS
jgi:aspartokinase-like uncharacterized kinase